jgi:hypothetical protein
MYQYADTFVCIPDGDSDARYNRGTGAVLVSDRDEFLAVLGPQWISPFLNASLVTSFRIISGPAGFGAYTGKIRDLLTVMEDLVLTGGPTLVVSGVLSLPRNQQLPTAPLDWHVVLLNNSTS